MAQLKARLNEDMKTAMRAKDKARLGVIRMALAAVKQREVDERISLDDSQLIAVIEKMIKQRRDSVAQYQDAGRTELADQELAEIAVLQEYLPAALSEAEIDAAIDKAIVDSGASSAKDMGKVMGVLKPQLQGRADFGEVGKKVKERLAAL